MGTVERIAAAISAAATVFSRPEAAKFAREIGPTYPGEAIRSTPGTIAADSPYNDRTPYIQGVNMSPASVTSALLQANLGYMARQSDLFSEQREKNPHLHAVLQTRELAISGSDWRIVPKEQAADTVRAPAKAQEIANYVDSVMRRIPHLGRAIRHLAGGIYYHASALEIGWGRDANGVFIKGLYEIQPKRLSYAASWRIHLYDENGNEYDPQLANFPGVDIFARYPGRFVLHAPEPMGCAIPTRQGVGRVLAFYNLFAIWSIRDWMQFAELFGQPWRVAFYDKNLDQVDIDFISNALDQMTSKTSAVLPKTAGFSFYQPNGQITVHHSLREALNAETSKAVLGQTLTTESPGHGTHALGKVQDRVRTDIYIDDCRAMSETVTEYIVKVLVLMQYGQEAVEKYCPNFQLITDKSGDISLENKRTLDGIDRGVPIEADDYRRRYMGNLPPAGDNPATWVKPIGIMGATKVSSGSDGGESTDDTYKQEAA